MVQGIKGTGTILGRLGLRAPTPLGVAVTIAEIAYFAYRVAREIEKERRKEK